MDILIIDDDQALRGTLSRTLERVGYSVATADCGLAGFAALRNEMPRAIVCDIRMPFLDGVGFYKELRDTYPELSQRVVFVTSFADDAGVRSFLDKEGLPVVSKPFELDDLLAAVATVAPPPA